MNMPVISTKDKYKMSGKDIGLYLIGVVAGVFLTIYSAAFTKNVMNFFFGLAILIGEFVIYLKEKASYRTYIEVFDDKVEGRAISSANAMVTIAFELKYEEITRVEIREAYIFIITGSDRFQCRTVNMTDQVKTEIEKRLSLV